MIGFIPGAPSYFSSMFDGTTCAYETALDERDTQQQMRDCLVEGHIKAEFIKNKKIDPLDITPYCYYGKVYLVGEYDGAEELAEIMKSVRDVPNKKRVIRRLYLSTASESGASARNYLISSKIKTRLTTDLDVSSTPIRVEVIQREVILLGVITDASERKKIIEHAQAVEGVRKVISFLKHSEAVKSTSDKKTALRGSAPKTTAHEKNVRPTHTLAESSWEDRGR